MDLKETLAKINMLEGSIPQSTRPETIYAKSMLVMAEAITKGLIIAIDLNAKIDYLTETINRRMAEIEETIRQSDPGVRAAAESLLKQGAWVEPRHPKFEISTEVPEPSRFEDLGGDPGVEAEDQGDTPEEVKEVKSTDDKVDTGVNQSTNESELDTLDMDQDLGDDKPVKSSPSKSKK